MGNNRPSRLDNGCGAYSETVDISGGDHTFDFTHGTAAGLYVGGAGNVTGRLWGDDADVVFNGVPAGSILPYRFTIIRQTGTTATSMVGSN